MAAAASPRAAKTAALKGLPKAQANAATESSGALSAIASARREGRQPSTAAISAAAMSACQTTAAAKASFEMRVSPERMSLVDGIGGAPRLGEHVVCPIEG